MSGVCTVFQGLVISVGYNCAVLIYPTGRIQHQPGHFLIIHHNTCPLLMIAYMFLPDQLHSAYIAHLGLAGSRCFPRLLEPEVSPLTLTIGTAGIPRSSNVAIEANIGPTRPLSDTRLLISCHRHYTFLGDRISDRYNRLSSTSCHVPEI